MKLTRKEFEDQLKLAKSLTGDTRSTMLASLKAAEVVEIKEVDGKPVETPVTVEIVETEQKAADPKADAEKATAGLIEADVERLLTKALAMQATATGPVTKVTPNDPNAGAKDFKIPAEVKRYGQIKNFAPVTRHGMEPDERAYALGQWAMAAMGNVKAAQWCADRGIKLMSEGTNTAGGYAVPEILSGDFIDLKETYGVARRLFGRYPMTSDTLKINRRTAGLTPVFVGEGAAGTESTPSLDQVTLIAKDLMAIARMTGQLNADSVINWSDRLAYEIGYGFSLKEDQCAFTGLATSTYGGITGVVQALTNKWTASVAGTATGITKATSTTLASLALGDFDNAVGSLPQFADTPNACWVMHRAVYYGIVEKLVQASGGVPAYEVRAGNRAPRPIFKGYPVEFSQVMPSTTAATTVFCLLGDFTLAAAFGDRQMDSVAFSDQASVGGQSMWERNEIGVRGIERFDINVHDVGDGTTPGPIVAVATG